MPKSRRRGAREGSIFERKDGRWVAAITVSEPGQKRRLLSSYHATQAEAVEGLDKLKERRKEGDTESESRRPTLAQHLETWLTHTVQSSVRPLTYVSYRQHVRVHLTPALGHIRLDKLSAPQVRAFLTEKLNAGLSPRTVKYSLVILRLALKQATDDRLISRNVAEAVKPPSYKRPQAVHLDAEQAQQLIRAAEGERLGAAYLVGLSVGLRRGELLALHWSDVDLDGRTLTVNQSLERIAGKLQFVAPKSKTSIRKIALPDELVSALRQHRVRQLQERLALGPDWKDSGLVFTTSLGTPIEPRNLTRDFKRILRKAGLPGTLRLHDLRHSTASLLLAQNVHPRVVMELLGHSQISLTLDTYSHVLPPALREAADKMSVALAGRK